jgi:tRNA pseudouridine38-40 synthase
MDREGMTHIVLIIAYDGTAYYGWQTTKEGPSVEAVLQTVLHQIFQEPIYLQAASRTDRGVHAEWQVVDFVTSKSPNLQRLVVSLNELLPSDVRCRYARIAPTQFHPTLDVERKTYRYLISTGPIQMPMVRFTHWHIYYPLDLSLLYETSRLFIGTKDFRGVCNRRAGLNEEDTIRSLFSIRICKGVQELAVFVEADHFLYKMVRNIVGTMVWVARGKTSLDSVVTALQTRKRAFSGVTAPAHGLSLVNVAYPF